MAAGHAYPAHLVEDVPGGEADPPTKFQPDPLHGCAVHALHTNRHTNNGFYIIDIHS